MAEKKYSGNLIRGPFTEGEGGSAGTMIQALRDEYGAGLSLSYRCINSTGFSRPEPLTHEYHEIIAFIGGNPENIHDFGAEVRICLGEEMEEHIITGPTVVSIPAGMSHCPLTVTKCEKPIVMLEVFMTK